MPHPVVEEELSLLRHVLEGLGADGGGGDRPDYDDLLVSLRDAVAEAKPEDVAPLVEQMHRVAALAAQHGRGRAVTVDLSSPYFGHMRLQERQRDAKDVLVGRASHVDPARGIRIVDWRNAPVSRLYYCYDEGDEYQETFGTRPVAGKVLARRAVSIAASELRRVSGPAGTFVRGEGGWREVPPERAQLRGGQGTALRPRPPAQGSAGSRKLGVSPEGEAREDKHLPEITALIDADQFRLITSPDSGLVVIRGGAGSGKTTVGLHRIAYLAYESPRRYAPDRMLVVVYNDALASYISQVLPALGLHGVRTVTFSEWAAAVRRRHFPRLPRSYGTDTPAPVSRAKRHPGVLGLLEEAMGRFEGGGPSSVLEAWAEAMTDRALLARHLGPEGPARRPLPRDDLEALVEWSLRQLRELEDEEGPSEEAWLDPEDDALLLRLVQLGGRRLAASSGKPLAYEHLMVDEAQDLSPVELAVLLGASAPKASVTLAGDAAQRLDLESGFESWEALLADLRLDPLTVTPLRLAYRSTAEIMALSRAVLGPLAEAEQALEATRSGAPVEVHRFSHEGEAVAMLAEALRDLSAREPLASVALVARHPERADLYFRTLERSEVPRLRRVADQDFAFRPGVEVTDVRQVKGLEFDYVVLLDVDAASYPTTDEARHLLHIGATRAAHQLWLVSIGTPSPLLASWLEARPLA